MDRAWARLTAPRRSGPILLVGLPLLSAQLVYTGTVDALLVGLVMVGGFLLAGPAGWRVLVSQGEAGRVSPPGALAFAGLGAGVVGLSGVALPVGMGLPPTFFTDPSSLAIMLALFWVGGWGLGRDIDLGINLERERARVADLARERERAELLAVRSHLDPHFLFNSLNAIAEWCNEDPAVAEEALLRLATMLRTVLHGVQAATWPLSRELALVDDLIAMHEVRDPTVLRGAGRLVDLSRPARPAAAAPAGRRERHEARSGRGAPRTRPDRGRRAPTGASSTSRTLAPTRGRGRAGTASPWCSGAWSWASPPAAGSPSRRSRRTHPAPAPPSPSSVRPPTPPSEPRMRRKHGGRLSASAVGAAGRPSSPYAAVGGGPPRPRGLGADRAGRRRSRPRAAAGASPAPPPAPTPR